MSTEDKVFLLVETFTPEQAALVRSEFAAAEEAAAELFMAGNTSSTFDLAWKLVKMGRLPEWGSALALAQNSGRGQLRREWFSPQGNMYASFRLPEGGVFSGDSATVLLGLLFCEAFAELGLELKLKWPNDLVLEGADGPGKLGGILLEEKNGVMVAGVGINSMHIPSPEKLRAGAVLPPVRLPDGFAFRSPIHLWLRLVHSLIIRYNKVFITESSNALLRRAEERLLWRGRDVVVSEESDGGEPFGGVISGLSGRGGLMLLTKGADGAPVSRELVSGSIMTP